VVFDCLGPKLCQQLVGLALSVSLGLAHARKKEKGRGVSLGLDRTRLGAIGHARTGSRAFGRPPGYQRLATSYAASEGP
jgi:hypothetical protein